MKYLEIPLNFAAQALFLLLHCTGVFLCFWGVLTRLD